MVFLKDAYSSLGSRWLDGAVKGLQLKDIASSDITHIFEQSCTASPILKTRMSSYFQRALILVCLLKSLVLMFHFGSRSYQKPLTSASATAAKKACQSCIAHHGLARLQPSSLQASSRIDYLRQIIDNPFFNS